MVVLPVNCDLACCVYDEIAKKKFGLSCEPIDCDCNRRLIDSFLDKYNIPGISGDDSETFPPDDSGDEPPLYCNLSIDSVTQIEECSLNIVLTSLSGYVTGTANVTWSYDPYHFSSVTTSGTANENAVFHWVQKTGTINTDIIATYSDSAGCTDTLVINVTISDCDETCLYAVNTTFIYPKDTVITRLRT